MIAVTGVVKDFQWVNPHTWLHIVVDNPKDGKIRVGQQKVARPASFFVPAGRRRRSKRVRRSPLT